MLLGLNESPSKRKQRLQSAAFISYEEVAALAAATRDRAASRLKMVGMLVGCGFMGRSYQPYDFDESPRALAINERALAALALSSKHPGPERITPYVHLEDELARTALGCMRAYVMEQSNGLEPTEVRTANEILDQAKQAGL